MAKPISPIACVYLGVKVCGCAVSAAVDDPDDGEPERDHTAKLVSEWIRRGMHVERTTVGEARQKLRRCHCAEERAEASATTEKNRAARARDMQAARLRDEFNPRLTFKQIGEQIGVSKSYARYCAARGRKWIAALPKRERPTGPPNEEVRKDGATRTKATSDGG